MTKAKLNKLRLTYLVGMLMSALIGGLFLNLDSGLQDYVPLVAFVLLVFAGMGIVVESNAPPEKPVSRKLLKVLRVIYGTGLILSVLALFVFMLIGGAMIIDYSIIPACTLGLFTIMMLIVQ